jgi:hypothetical protein
MKCTTCDYDGEEIVTSLNMEGFPMAVYEKSLPVQLCLNCIKPFTNELVRQYVTMTKEIHSEINTI